ncbi:MAG: DUF2764 domain-containing protein [Prevotellaceae bacterium]|jgi:hypothetical protein|nr:DUF2764 domain-containing protein [Prevotellaceae bacterium]MDR0560861.1 DUF2764 domain-containing protein [Prevotellaceae bacterium]
MTRNYYHLVASLPDLLFKSDSFKNVSLLQIRNFIMEEVSAGDLAYMYEILSHIDNYNLITHLYGKNRAWKTGGKFDAESFSNPHDTNLPEYMRQFFDYIEKYKSENGTQPDCFLAEQYLYKLCYESLEASKNMFVSKYSRLEKEIRNVQTAYLCRQSGISFENQFIAEDELTEMLAKSQAQDFGLSKEWDYLAGLVQIFDVKDLFEREMKLDMFRWNNIDEINVFEYFTVNMVLGTLQKACIAERWMAMDGSKGEKIFKKLINELKSWNLKS